VILTLLGPEIYLAWGSLSLTKTQNIRNMEGPCFSEEAMAKVLAPIHAGVHAHPIYCVATQKDGGMAWRDMRAQLEGCEGTG